MRKCCVSWFQSIRQALPALVLIAAAGAPAQAQDEKSWRIRENGARIVDYGIYTYRDLGYVEAPGDLSGWRFSAVDVRLIRRTQTILAQPFLTFGMRFRVSEESLIGKTLALVIRFPRMTNPESGRSASILVDRFVARGSLRRQLFRFDQMWEMAEGRWTMTVLDGRRVVARVPFRVVVAVN